MYDGYWVNVPAPGRRKTNSVVHDALPLSVLAKGLWCTKRQQKALGLSVKPLGRNRFLTWICFGSLAPSQVILK